MNHCSLNTHSCLVYPKPLHTGHLIQGSQNYYEMGAIISISF